MSEKYNTNDPAFDEKHGVLKNKLNISNQKKLNFIEGQALIEAYENSITTYSEDHIFCELDVLNLHKLFLKDIFDWAGEYRTVDISSEDIRWCHSQFIKTEMKRYSKTLSSLTPFKKSLTRNEIIRRLSKIHGELIVIHPFRDGNGRVTRLLCDLLFMQADYEPIQKDIFYNKNKLVEYYAAIRSVWQEVDYTKLIKIFDELIS